MALTPKKLKKILETKKKRINYQDGHEAEKVWINFQVTKGEKRSLMEKVAELKKTNKDFNASVWFRQCLNELLNGKS